MSLEDIIKEMWYDEGALDRWWGQMAELVARRSAQHLDHEITTPKCKGCSACQPTIGRMTLRVVFGDAWNE